MKNLSFEIIRDLGDRLPDDLSGILRGFKKFSKVLEIAVSDFASQRLTFTPDGIEKALVRPSVSKDGSYPGMSKVLVDLENGSMIQVTLGRDLVNMLCEAAFGGDGSEKNIDENRPLSSIERELAIQFIKIVGREFSTSFASDDRLQFVVPTSSDPLEENIAPILKSKLSVKLRCNLKSLIGHLHIDLPAEIISLFDNLTLSDVSKKNESIEKWGDQIIEKLEPTNIDLTAILTEFPLTLDAIANLRVGSIIPLGVNIRSPIILEADDVDLYQAQLGQNNGHYCLVLESLNKVI